LPAIAVGGVVLAAQCDVAAGTMAANAAVRSLAVFLAVSLAVIADDAGSMPARRTSRPSSRRKPRASITTATRPSPCGSNKQAAASAGATQGAATSATQSAMLAAGACQYRDGLSEINIASCSHNQRIPFSGKIGIGSRPQACRYDTHAA